MKQLIMIILIGLSGVVNAQTGGTIKGKVFGSDSTTIIPFADVKVVVAGVAIGVKTDFEGRYKISGINAGLYTVDANASLNGKRIISGVVVDSDQITALNIYLGNNILDEIPVIYTPPKLDINNSFRMSKAELKGNINIQNPKKMLAIKSSEITMTADNQLIIRGSRAGDVIYYVDGVKQADMQSIPGIAIGGMTVYTGGIPAKYGDTTGGVVILETKSYFDLYYAWKAQQ